MKLEDGDHGSVKVLLLTPFFPGPHDATWGNFVYQQARALEKLGHEPSVVLLRPWIPPFMAGWDETWRRWRDLPRRYEMGGLTVRAPVCLAVPRYLWWQHAGLLRYLSLKNYLTDLHREKGFDLVHGHGLVAGDVAGRIGRHLGLPSLVTVHGVEEAAIATEARRAAMKRIFRAVEVVLVVGSPLERWLKPYMESAMKMEGVPNGVDPSMLVTEPPERLARSKGNSLVILSVSRLDRGKGIEENLRALGLLPRELLRRLQYWIVGAGHLEAALRKLCAELELGEAVTFWGPVDHAGIGDYYAACDIFSLPGWQEAFGLTYLEAMLHAKPVIGCRGQGAEDLVIDGSSGFLVQPRDTTDLARLLKRLLEDGNLRRSLGLAGKERALAHFTWEHSARRLERVYGRVLGRVGHGAA